MGGSLPPDCKKKAASAAFCFSVTPLESILALVTLAALVGCACPTANSPVNHVSITGVDWVVENIDKSFWSPAADKGWLYYDFWIDDQGTLNLDDIKQVRMILPRATDDCWTLYPSEGNNPAQFVHTADSSIGGYGRWYLRVNDVDWGQALPLGTLTAVIEYMDGTQVTKTWDSHEPGSLSSPTHNYVINEDLTTTPDGSSPVKALARPVLNSATLNSSSKTLEVSLELKDSNTSNGFLWFYDVHGNYLGQSVPFRNPTSGEVSSMFGSSNPTLNTLGGNTLTLAAANLLNDDGTQGNFLNQIKTVIPVATDGAQFIPVATTYKYGRYNDSSIGAKVSVTVIP